MQNPTACFYSPWSTKIIVQLFYGHKHILLYAYRNRWDNSDVSNEKGYTKIRIGTSDSWPSLFMWGMNQNTGHGMFWCMLINSELPAAAQLIEKSLPYQQTVRVLSSSPLIRLNGAEVFFAACFRSATCSTSTCEVLRKLTKLSDEFWGLSSSRSHQGNAHSKENIFQKDRNQDRDP